VSALVEENRTDRRASRPATRAWIVYLTIYLGGLIAYVLLPDGPLFGLVFLILPWSGVAAMVVGLLRHRRRATGPLWFLAAYAACGAAGLFVMMALGMPASPGPQDAVFILGNSAQIAGMVWLLRLRVPAHNRERLLDAAVISCGFALLAAIFLIKPAITAAGSAAAAVVLGVYPMVDLFIFALLVSLLLSGGLGSTAMRLVASSQLALLVFDCGYAFIPAQLFQNTLLYHATTAISLAVYGLLGAAALHPGFPELAVASPASVARPQMPWIRTPLLWTAVMTGPALLIFEAWRYESRVPDAPIIAVGCVVIFGLVIGRLQMLVSRVNSQSAVLAEQAERLNELASCDGLTGLTNRRTWDGLLAGGLERARRQNTTTTVVLIDIDHFKHFNDTLGHQAGDRLLKEAAAAWRGQLRDNDVLARYGGEEFIALLPECDATGAAEILDRLRDVMPEHQTFSAGIATWDGEEAADRLVARADAALYAAKNAGRNRATVAETHQVHQLGAPV
jgi:diguanylate cyclase (GGDEF)-like protein